MSTFQVCVPLYRNVSLMNKWEDYIEDQKFVKWVFEPDENINRYFEDYLRNHPEQKEELFRAKEELHLLSISNPKISFEKGLQLYQSIMNQVSVKDKRTFRIRRMGVFMRYAAIAILFLAIGSMLVYFPTRGRMDLKLAEELFLRDAQYYPVLYFEDGSKQEVLSENKYIDLSVPGKLIIGNDTLSQNNVTAEKKLPNLFIVPNGQRLKVCLNDKSEVWLNAGSRLILPKSFSKKKREVYLAGEAFLDVSTDLHNPFIVNTSTIAVKVLGTKFNVSAYPEDNEVLTVLQEGKVQILDNNAFFSEVKAELSPNEIARYNKTDKQLDVHVTNHELYTQWKDGSLRFEYQQASDMIRKVERYFDIRILLKDPAKGDEKINGKLDLNVNMDEVLEYITKITHAEIRQIDNKTYLLE